VFNLAGLLESTIWRDGPSFEAADIMLLHVNGLGAYAGAYLLLDPVRADVLGPLAAGLAVFNGALGYLLRTRCREEALHFAALGLALLTAAVALQLEGPWVTNAWAAEGALAAWLGLRERREWLRTGGLALFAIAVVRLVALQLSDPPVGQLLLLNQRAASGLFLTALAYALTFAHHRYGDPARSRTQTGAGLVAAKLLLLGVAASEISDYWLLHAPPPFEPAAQLIGASFIAGALIMWLGVSRNQEWVRAAGAAVVALAAFWLFSIQLEAAPSRYVPVVNGRAAAGLLAVLILYGLVVAHRRAAATADMAASIAVLMTSASLLTLSLLTSEIDAFWAARGAPEVWSVAREGLQAIAWAGIGSFVVWLGLSNRRTWVRALGGALVAVGVLRLLRLQSAAAAPTYVVLTNARVLASLVTIALLYGLAHLYSETPDVAESVFAPAAVLWVAASVVTLTLLTSEITAYWHVQDIRHAAMSRTGHASDSHFAREMMLSITWAVYATLLVVAGLRRRYAPIRYFAMTIFVITIVKVFTIDLAELDRLYRVLSVIGLGVTLLLTSYLYQKISPDRGDPEPSGH
jgi:hypothetical protein